MISPVMVALNERWRSAGHGDLPWLSGQTYIISGGVLSCAAVAIDVKPHACPKPAIRVKHQTLVEVDGVAVVIAAVKRCQFRHLISLIAHYTHLQM
jgi:hypothetical protein